MYSEFTVIDSRSYSGLLIFFSNKYIYTDTSKAPLGRYLTTIPCSQYSVRTSATVISPKKADDFVPACKIDWSTRILFNEIIDTIEVDSR